MRIPCNSHTHTHKTHLTLSFWLRHTLRSVSDSDHVLPQIKTKYSMKSFPPAGWTWGDCVLERFKRLVSVFLCFPSLSSPIQTQKTNELVIQVNNHLKLWWSLLFGVRVCLFKAFLWAFKPNIQRGDESQNDACSFTNLRFEIDLRKSGPNSS